VTKKIAIAPKIGSSSVGVLVATPNDVGTMIATRTWVKAFADKVGEPGVTVRSLGAVEALVGTLSDLLLQGKDATIPNDTLDSMFGGLRGHTLIWVAPNHGPDLVLFAGATGQAVTITTSDLAGMQLVKVGEVQWVLHPQGLSNHRLFQISLFLTLMRLSFYTQIYLCVVANQHRPAGTKPADRAPEATDLDAIAKQLNNLTGCTVYYNDVGIEIAGKDAVVPSGTTLAPASGKELLSEKSTTLSAPAGTFFRGSVKRV
jgi:hypothetical protein